MSTPRDRIIALEHDFWKAVQAKDGSATAALSGDTALVTGVRGVMAIARDKMGGMTETDGWTLDSYDLQGFEVVFPTDDVAITAYEVRQKITANGETREFRAADSSTWVNGPDGWTCHAHSETPLDAE